MYIRVLLAIKANNQDKLSTPNWPKIKKSLFYFGCFLSSFWPLWADHRSSSRRWLLLFATFASGPCLTHACCIYLYICINIRSNKKREKRKERCRGLVQSTSSGRETNGRARYLPKGIYVGASGAVIAPWQIERAPSSGREKEREWVHILYICCCCSR